MKRTLSSLSRTNLLILLLLSSMPCFSQWQSLNGPNGGEITVLEHFGPRLYCGTSSGGLYYKEQSNPWQLLYTFDNSIIYSIYHDDNFLWIGTSEATLYLELDQNGNLDQVIEVSSEFLTYDFLRKDNELFMATSNGIYRHKVDAAESTQSNTGLPREFPLATGLTFFDDKLYALVGGGEFIENQEGEYRDLSGIYVSEDNGWTWKADTIINNATIDFYNDEDRLYAGTYSGLFYKNRGDTVWTSVADFTNKIVADLTRFENKLLATTSSGIYVSWNGSAWSPSRSTPGFVLYADEFEGKLYSGGFGMYATPDLEDWESETEGITATEISTFCVSDEDLITGTKTSGLFAWHNTGAWINRNNDIGDDQLIHTILKKDQLLFMSTGGIGMLKSPDNGETWESAQGNLPIEIIPAALASKRDTVFAMSPVYGMYITLDDGLNWIEYNEGLLSRRGAYELYSITVSENNVYVSAGDGVYILDQANAAWVSVSGGNLPPGPKSVLKDGSRIIVTAIGGLYYTDNNGESWDTLPLEGIHGQNIFLTSNLIKAHNNYYMICKSWDEDGTTYDFVYSSPADNIHWEVLDVNYPQHAVPVLLLCKGDYLYVGTGGGGVYRHLASGVITASEESVREVHVEQNYPNPVRTTTTIEYQAVGHHNIILLDYKGNTIAKFQGEQQHDNNYQLNLDMTSFRPGYYFYYLQTRSGRSQVRKIIKH